MAAAATNTRRAASMIRTRAVAVVVVSPTKPRPTPAAVYIDILLARAPAVWTRQNTPLSVRYNYDHLRPRRRGVVRGGGGGRGTIARVQGSHRIPSSCSFLLIGFTPDGWEEVSWRRRLVFAAWSSRLTANEYCVTLHRRFLLRYILLNLFTISFKRADKLSSSTISASFKKKKYSIT